MSALKKQQGGGHYKGLKLQPVEIAVANGLPFIEGCILKYVLRHRGKGGAEDIRKAIHFCELLLELEYGKTHETRRRASARGVDLQPRRRTTRVARKARR